MDKILLESMENTNFSKKLFILSYSSNDFNRLFSWCRLSNAINYFKNRGHENIIAFLPLCMIFYNLFSLFINNQLFIQIIENIQINIYQ
jgi:hypothetical protein